jgi:acylphosphatase
LIPEAGQAARLEASVHGRVQGVGFRYFVLDVAEELGLTGWVANQRDGSVVCVAEGGREDLDRLLDLLRCGPAGSRVTSVEHNWSTPTGQWSGFSVKAGGHSGD